MIPVQELTYLRQELGDAAEVTNNPVGVVYQATLPDSAFFKPAYPNGGNIKGTVRAEANDDGRGVRITLDLENLPKTGGPFCMLPKLFPSLLLLSQYSSLL